MLAPTYGMVDFSDAAWVNYHRFARSPWCANFDPEFGALRWSPRGFAAGALDGTAFFSRLAGSITRQEMVEAFRTLWDCAVDEVTGSVFWWPHGLEYKRSLTRCSQGQGAFAWHYLRQWLGLEVDAASHTLTVAPRGLLTGVTWRGFRAGPYSFDILWHEGPNGDDDGEEHAGVVDTGAVSPWQTGEPDERYTLIQVTNHNTEPWMVRVGLRPPDTGAAGTMAWRAGLRRPRGHAADAARRTKTAGNPRASPRPRWSPRPWPPWVTTASSSGDLGPGTYGDTGNSTRCGTRTRCRSRSGCSSPTALGSISRRHRHPDLPQSRGWRRDAHRGFGSGPAPTPPAPRSTSAPYHTSTRRLRRSG